MKKIWTMLMRFARFCLTLVAKPLHLDVTDENWNVWEQFIKFVLVGCSNALITLLVYYAIVLAFGKSAYLAGQTVGYIAGIFNSFFWNSRFVFSAQQASNKQAFVKMCVCYGATYFVQTGLLYLFVSVWSMSEFLAPILAILITTPINFALNKLWAFRAGC